MTVSPDARTPSADLHTLTGSTPPGAGPRVQPFGIAAAPVAELPDPFVTLGATAAGVVEGLAEAHPDAEVIDLAGRVKRLAERNYVCRARAERIEARIRAVHPSSTKRFGWAATREEFEAHRREIEPVEKRLGLTRLRRRGGRMMNRLARWPPRLISLAPWTQAGLAAKAAVALAFEEWGTALDWTQALMSAVSRDAARLAAVSVTSPAEPATDPFTGYHAEIQQLQATINATEEGHPARERAWSRWKDVDDLALAGAPITLAGAIGALEYARREQHQFRFEGFQDCDLEPEITDRLVLHLIDGALGVLRGLAGSAERLEHPEPPAGFASAA